MSYVTKEKHFKSVKGLQRNFRKCNLTVFCEYLEIKAETKKTLRVNSVPPMGLLSPLKIFTLKMGTPCRAHPIAKFCKKITTKIEFF